MRGILLKAPTEPLYLSKIFYESFGDIPSVVKTTFRYFFLESNSKVIESNEIDKV